MAHEYELNGNPKYRTAAETFWTAVAGHRSCAVGGDGEREHFFAVTNFPDMLTPHTCETCNTYNMLKLTGHLFAWEPSAHTMDFAECAMINHIRTNVVRKPGEYGYFFGRQLAGTKVFSTPFDSWWCCFGAGLENPARYGGMVYYHAPKGAEGPETLWVNLFMGSELNWEEKGLKLRQETAFPGDDKMRFEFETDAPVKLNLKIRRSEWCAAPGATAAFGRQNRRIDEMARW